MPTKETYTDEEIRRSQNAPDQFYAPEQSTGYDPNDRRDMMPIDTSLTPTAEIIKETEQKHNSRFTTPKGREIDRDNFSLSALAPEVFQKMQADEIARADMAERRVKGRQTGMLISDALKSLVDVVGEVKGAHNAPRTPEDYKAIFSQLDGLDADHANALQGIAGAKLKAAQAADTEAGRNIDRSLREAEINRKREQGDDNLDWYKERFEQDQNLKKQLAKDNLDAEKAKADEANKTRLKISNNAAHRGTSASDPKVKKYRYSTSDNDRKNANYKDIGANEEGTIEVAAEHVARYKDMYVDKYNQLVAQRDKLLKSGGDFLPVSQQIKAMENSDAFKAAFDASNGGVLTDAQTSSIMKEVFTPENYQHMRNKEYATTPKAETPVTFPGQEVLMRLWSNPDIIKINTSAPVSTQTQPSSTPQPAPQPVTPPVQTQTTPQAPQANDGAYQYHTPGLNAKPGSPEHTKAVAKVIEADYRGLSQPEMQDKVMMKVTNRIKKYHSEYGKDNTSPMAQNHKEKMSLEIYNELEDYWKNTPGAMEELKAYAKQRSQKGHNITPSDIIMEIADGIAKGTKNINDIL